MKVAQQFVIPVIFSLEKKPGVTGESSYKYENYDASIVTEKAAQQIQDNQQGEPSFVYVEQQASFKGGDLENFREWVQKNLIYPEVAKENGIFGRITLQFAVNSQGKVVDVKVLRGVDPSLDNEAIRVVTSSPDWVPAKQSGKNVKQQFVMPVVFPQGEKASTINQQNGDEPAFVFVEEQALFQGGTLDVFREWVQKHLIYPDEAIKQGIFGRITIQFAVNSEGKVCDIKIIRGVHPSLDAETMRVVGQSPVWTPAKQGGKKVKQLFVIPVIFQLQK
jgi:TonB family protein